MEEDRESIRYWCHQCTRPVVPILGVETVKCSSCNGEFVEEMSSVTADQDHQEIGSDSDRDRALSLWAPILLGMMNNPRRARRFRHSEFDHDDEEGDRLDSFERYRRFQFQNPRDEMEREGIDDVVRRRRRGPTVTLQLSGDGDRERVIMINPFNQTIVVQGGGGGNGSQTHPIGSLGDYFTGHGLEQLLQHLAENDPNRYGTPPAKKEAVEAIPTVTIKEQEKAVQCSVCLDDFEVGNEVKEMPCKHMFHDKCIIPWLELHSSCPVCRYELPSDETKLNQEREGNTEDGDEGNLSRFSVSLPWPFSSLFSSSGPESGSSVTSTSATGGSSSAPPHGEEDHN